MSVINPVQHSRGLQIKVVPQRERVIVAPIGELDHATAGSVEREVRELGARGFATVVLDMRGIDFVDSSGLQLLQRLEAAAEAGGWVFATRGGSAGPAQRVEGVRTPERYAAA